MHPHTKGEKIKEIGTRNTRPTLCATSQPGSLASFFKNPWKCTAHARPPLTVRHLLHTAPTRQASRPVQKATLIARNGRIEAIGTSRKVPHAAQRVDVSGKTIIPGLISAHSHVSDASQLSLFARHRVPAVFSLGGDKEIAIRDQVRAEQQTPGC